MLQPIGGSIATFGMHIPYVIMAVVATASIVVVASVMREAKTIRGLQEEGRGFWCDCLAKGKSGHNESDFGLDLSEMDPVDDGSNGVDVHAAKVDESKTSSLSGVEVVALEVDGAKTAAEKNKKKKQTARVTGTERANQLAGKVDLEDNNARAARLTKIRESIKDDDY